MGRKSAEIIIATQDYILRKKLILSTSERFKKDGRINCREVNNIKRDAKKLMAMTDEELIQFYKDEHKVPRDTAPFKRAKAQIEQGIVDKLKYTILKEAVEIQRVDGWICMFCLIQLMKRDGKLYNRFTYTYLKKDGNLQSGGQTTLVAEVDVIKKLLKKYEEQSLDMM